MALTLSRLFIRIFLTLIFVFPTIGCNKEKKEQNLIPLEDFFRNPEKTSFLISPDGYNYSYLAPYEGCMNIYVQKIGSDSAIRVTNEKNRSIATYYWANNNRILFLNDSGGDENFRLYGVNADGSNLKTLTDFPGVRTQIIDLLNNSDNDVIIGMNKDNPQVFDPYRINIETGELTQLATNPGNIQSWLTDHEGKLRVAISLEGTNRTLLYRDKEGTPFRSVYTTSFKESLSPISFTPNNKKLYAISNVGHDKKTLIIFDPQKGKEEEVLYEDPKYDIHTVMFSDKKRKPEFVSWRSLKYTGYHFFDESYKTMFDKLKSKLSGYEIIISSVSKDEGKMIINTYSDKDKGSYYLYNAVNEELTKIADIAPWLKKEEMSEINCLTYKSRDGFSIEAYLTLPKGYTMETARNLPVIVNPHGGPSERNYWKFFNEPQFLANRGYAVFQMNFRGSSGYGRKFIEASYKEWGLKMQDDVTDGVNWLIQQKIADPDRIAIYGASYGGYSTLIGLTLTPELYACGIDYVGISNLFTFLKSFPSYWKPRLDIWYETIGNPVTDSLQLAKTSPALNADKVKAPLFIAQGANDPRVKKSESDQMVNSLKERGIDVEYMVKDNEGHMFKNEDNILDFYRTMETFLAKHLK